MIKNKLSIGNYTLWSHKRLRELSHQMTGRFPSIRMEKMVILPFGLALEWHPSAWRKVYDEAIPPWVEHIARVTMFIFDHFGLEPLLNNPNKA